MTLPIIINIILELAFAIILSLVISFAIHIFVGWVAKLTYNKYAESRLIENKMNIFKKIRLRRRMRVRIIPTTMPASYKRSEFKVQKRWLFIWWCIYCTNDVNDALRYVEELSLIRDIKALR